MRVETSQLSINSDRFYAEHSERKERTVRVKGNKTTIEEKEYYRDGKARSIFENNYDNITLSDSKSSQTSETSETENSFQISYTEKDKQKIKLIEEMMKVLTGKKDFTIKLSEFDPESRSREIKDKLQKDMKKIKRPPESIKLDISTEELKKKTGKGKKFQKYKFS